MQAGFHQGAAGVDLAGDGLGAEFAAGLERNDGGGRLVAIARLEGRLQGTELFGIHVFDSRSLWLGSLTIGG